jgi:dolichol-phosphate mannosyltransferase
MAKIVAVVLPTFNEKDNIENFTNQVLAQQENLPGYEIEVVIADSKSPDGTGEIAKQLAERNKRVHFISVDRGLGVGLIKGHQYSLEHIKPDILAQLDADGQVDVAVLPKLIKAVDEGYTLVLGSRFVPGGGNKLSLSRRIFSAGASWVVRVIMGPWNIKEVTNSARAFTPELFRKINLDRLPWTEKTFIVQPAFLHEAILAGARYKEVPLVFKNRAEGYSKNKTINYTYDVITYSIDARLHQMGIDVPFFQATRKAKTLIKFGVVGFSGTFVDFFFYKLFIWTWGLSPAMSKGISTETAIINNFILNNIWTFRHRKTEDGVFLRFLKFNGVSLVGLAIAVGIVWILDKTFGNGFVDLGFRKVAYNNFYFFATIPPVMIWNFVANHLFTWKHKD